MFDIFYKHSDCVKLEKEVKRLCNLEQRFFETFKDMVVQKRENKLLQKELDEKKRRNFRYDFKKVLKF